ncbi:recombinase family protein [Chloroflexota bacterium]
MKAALYARVSTQEQVVEGYSIDAQRRAFSTLCDSKQWTRYREYIDEGKPARTEDIRKRPAFKEAIDDGISKKYDVLVVHKVDRFSRKLSVTLDNFDKLSKVGVGFVSIIEQMDFSTPWGKFTLSMLGGLAELYSDNLSQETKKGWAERRAQGLYCGAIPFGAMKDEDGVPVPDTQDRKIIMDGKEYIVHNYEGLTMAFNLVAQGKSIRGVAIALNEVGYKTTGTHGPRPFSVDTVKYMLKNRFYIGDIPDGNRGWIKAKHKPFIELQLFEEVQTLRARRAAKPRTIRLDASVYSLSGVALCAECGSTLRSFKGKGRVRLACNGRLRGGSCPQPSSFLEIYEKQLAAYLGAFHIPPDYQKKIMEAHSNLQSAYDSDKRKAALETRLRRVKELYEWGHKTKEEYLADCSEIRHELQKILPEKLNVDVLVKLADFLRDIRSAWKQASQEARNRLATTLFEAVWIKDRKVVAVTPRSEFKPFFDLQYAGKSNYVLQMRPRRDSNPRSLA